jgi:hypothetical protein
MLRVLQLVRPNGNQVHRNTAFVRNHYAMNEAAGKTAAEAEYTSPTTTSANYRELVTADDARKY